jgi:glutathione S-transferase
MKLIVCYGTFRAAPRPGGHPCGKAHDALVEAGYDPEIQRAFGLAILPDALANWTAGRREAKRLTGNSMVPVLVTDDGEVVQGSDRIVEWASAHPAGAGAPSGG